MLSLNSRPIKDILEDEQFKKGLRLGEHVVQYINKKFISLNDNDYTIYAEHLKKVLSKLVQLMKDKDALFNKFYQKEHFAGSYPDGLKIGKPTEYDMNLIIRLPVDQSKLEFEPATPSFIKIKGKEAFSAAASLTTDLVRWIDEDGYLLQTKFRDWMESVLTKAFDTLPLDKDGEGNTRCLNIDNAPEEEYKIRYKKSGPAMTLKAVTPDGCSLDVDLVPAFQFGPGSWPDLPVQPPPEKCSKKHWMVVPKPKKLKEGETLVPSDTREWRMSFLDQERELLNGSGTVKPTIKLLKKLRDSTNIKLSSYAIKTVVLFEMKTQNPEFWRNRQLHIFLYMLYRLTEQIKTGHIPFYWDSRDDLLKLGKLTSDNVANRLGKILKDIVKVIEADPYVIAEKLLSKEDYMEVKENCNVPTGNAASAKGPTPSLAQAIGGNQTIPEQQIDSNTLIKILSKLAEIQEGQSAGLTLALQAIASKKSVSQQEDLEERVLHLEETVYVLKKEIKQLKEKKNNSS